MSGGKEIRQKIKTIKSTQKITRAMEMVAASKMRKAQERMLASRPYAEKISLVIQRLIASQSDYVHPYTKVRPIKKVGFIVISSDRGLCGGLNVNLFKTVVRSMKSFDQQKIGINIATLGRKAESFYKKLGGNLVASHTLLGKVPGVEDLFGLIKVMTDAFQQEEIDALYLCYNRFVNTMTQSPSLDKLLPVEANLRNNTLQGLDYIYEPDPKSLLDSLYTRYLESLIYQGMAENLACEQSARMVAMKSASDNAAELIDDLQLKYNKARQAAITQELSEIVAGAAAV